MAMGFSIVMSFPWSQGRANDDCVHVSDHRVLLILLPEIIRGPAVIFQEVVHSTGTREADCAEAITSEEKLNGHPPECPTYAAPSRGSGSIHDPRRDVEAGRGQLQHHCQNRRQVGSPSSRSGRIWPAGSLVAPPGADQLANQANAELARGEEILAEAQKAGFAPQTPVANNPLPNAASPQSAADSSGQKSADPKAQDPKALDPNPAGASAEGKKYVLFEGTRCPTIWATAGISSRRCGMDQSF